MEEPEDHQKDATAEPSANQEQDAETAAQEHLCCSFCKERFLAIEDLLAHIRIHTGGGDSEEDQEEVQVPQRMKWLSVRLPLLKTGKMSSLDSIEGDDVSGAGETGLNISSTSQDDEKSGSEFKRSNATSGYQCPTCNRRFSRIIHQLNHKCEPTGTDNRLNAINSGLKLYKCITCMAEFGTRQEKQEHTCLPSEPQIQYEEEPPNLAVNESQEFEEEQDESDTEHSEDELEEAGTSAPRPKLVIKFPMKKAVGGKAKRRKAKGSHRCKVCRKNFTRAWNLKVHMQKAHPPGSEYVQPPPPKAPPVKVSPAKASPRVSPKPAKKRQEPPPQRDGDPDFDFCPSYSEKNMVLRRLPSSNAYECPLCGKTMERREAILSHIRDHRSETPYSCSHCDFKCAHSARIIKHMSQSHRLYQPIYPSQFEASKGTVQDADWQPRKEPYRSFYKIVRSEKERMYKPKKIATTGHFGCPLCPKTFARFGVAQVHIRVHTGEAPFRCLLCDYQGKQQSLILAHLEHNHKEIISNSNSARDEEVDAELAMEDGDDDVDEESWEKNIDFEEGVVNNQPEEEEEPDPFQDESSEEVELPEEQQPVSEDAQMIEDGYDFKFRPSQNEQDRVLFRSSLTKMFLCYLCTKEIKEKEIMLAHIRTHTGDKAYFCCHCEFGSAHDAAMRKHLHNVHSIKHAKRPENHVQTHIRMVSKRPSKPIMITKTKTTESLKTSPKPTSKQAKPKVVEEAAPPKASEHEVQQKVGKKKPKKDKSAPKQNSGPSYKDFYTMSKSAKEEQSKPQRNEATGLYKCHFCKLESYSYKTVVIHTRSHTGEKPYKCRLCTFNAAQSSHVIRHLKNTHRVSLDGADESDDADEEPPELKEAAAPEEDEEVPPAQEEAEPEEEPTPMQDDGELQGDADGDVDLDPVDYFAPPVPEKPLDLLPKLVYKDEESLDEAVDEGSQEGGDNDPDWETWMDRKKTLSTEVRTAFKGKSSKGAKIISPRNAQVNYIFAPSEAEKNLDLKKGADRQYECPSCGKKMRELEIILAHIRTHSGDKPYSCVHCDFVSAHIASIRKHVIRVHNVKRPIAGSDTNTPLIATASKVTSIPAPKVVKAVKEPKKESPRAEMKKESGHADGEGEPDMEERPYSEGTSEGLINQYFKVSKRVKPTDKQYIPTRDPMSGKAQCRICKGTFSSYGKAVVHIRSHTGEKPYQCLLCDYRSSQNPNMKRHIRNQHKEVTYGESPGVVKKTPTKTPNDPDTSANDDSFADIQSYDDDDHDLSGPSMVQRSDFLSQAAVVEQGASRPGRPDYLYEPTERMRNFEPKRCPSTGMFECTFCSSQFYGLKKIETHILKHTGEKPYLCMHCDFKSAYSFVMYRHLLKRHGIQTPKHPGSAEEQLDEIRESEKDVEGMSTFSETQVQDTDSAYTTMKPPSPEPSVSAAPKLTFPEGTFDFIFRLSEFELNQVIESIGSGRYKCPHCKKVMSNRKKMITHMRTHTGAKPFHCCHCDFKTAYKFVIQTHMKGIHKILEPKGDDELIEAQLAQDHAAESIPPGVAETPAVQENVEKIVIKQEPPDDMETDVRAPDGGGFDAMVANMAAGAGSDPKDNSQGEDSQDDDNMSDYSIQKEGQKPDCVFRPTEEEKNRKLYRPSPSGPCQCPFCNRWLQGLENMRAHIRGHTGDKPYLCCHCDHKSAHFAAIKRHLRKMHQLNRPVMPGYVTLRPKSKPQSSAPKLTVPSFKAVSFPSNPLKPTQTKFKPTPAVPSPSKSTQSASYRKSMAPFTGRDRSLTQFYRNFYTVQKSEDMKKFTPKKDPVTKLFHCNFCGKRFNYHTEAQVHTRTHTGEKPYECLICDYKGSQWTNIVRHITCVHKAILEARQREEGIGNLPPAKESPDPGVMKSSSFNRTPPRTPPRMMSPHRTPPRVMSPERLQNYDAPLDLATSSKSQAAYDTPNDSELASSKEAADYVFNPSEEERKRVILPSPRTGLYSCTQCKKKVPNLGKIVTHMRTHSGDKPYICCHCNFKSAYKFVIKQHLSGRHGIKYPKQMANGVSENGDVGETPDQVILKIPSVPAAPAARVAMPEGAAQQPGDFKFQPSERETTMQLKRLDRTGCYECPFCGRQFSSNETIKAHIRGHTGDKAYYCNHCSFASAHIKSIRNHIQKVHLIAHPRRVDDHGPPRVMSPPQLQIPQPQQQLHHQQQQHQQQQQQQRVMPANQIPKEIYMKYVGVKKLGPKKFPPKRNPRTGHFKCHFCTMESKQLYTVEIHTMRHTGEKPYHCKLCEYKATRQWLVTQHLQTNHKYILAANEGLTLIPRESMKPPAPTAVKLPVSETTGDNIVVCRSAKSGLYYCSECRKEFMSASQCRDHIVTHSHDKQYQCPFCDHRSAHGGAMRNHMKIQHGNDSDELKKWYSYTMGQNALRHVFQRDQDGMYMCTYCNKKSGSLNSARKHLCVHTGEKPYSCKLCDFKAIHNISIRLHVTGHHKEITGINGGATAATTNPEVQPRLYPNSETVSSEPQMVGDDIDEEDWEDEEHALEEEQMVAEGHPALGKMEETLQQFTATSPVVPPVGQVTTKDADFLYVPSDVDKEVVLTRSEDSQMYECPMCDKQMTNTRTMRAHIRLHKGEKAYHCCHCDYKSAHYSVLRKHVVQVHKIQRPRMAQESDEQEGPWVGQQVKKSPPPKRIPTITPREEEIESIDNLQLANPSNIPTNMNPETDSGFVFDANKEEKEAWSELQSSGSCQCPQCGKQCSSPIRTLQHMRTHSGAKPYHCRYCTFRSAYDTSMRCHVRTLHERGGAWASSAAALQKNGSEVEGDENLENNATLSKIAALEGKSSVSKVRAEEKSSDLNSDTPEMAWTFNEEDQSATLVPQYFAPPIIEDEQPPSLQAESSHGEGERSAFELLHSEIRGKTPSMMPKYNTIQKQSSSQGKSIGDFTFTPTQQEKDRVVPRSPTSGQYKCPYCPQELTSVDKIKAHIRKHTGDRPYQCLHCKFTSAYRFVIRTHIKNLHKIPEPKEHKGEVPVENISSAPPMLDCVEDLKSRSPANLGGLADVYRPILVDEKRSSPKRFLAAGKVSWDGHFKYIQSETEKRLVLNRCSSTGKFQCPECTKVLGNIDVMRAHVRTHTGEKPYYCCHCDFQSAHYDSIRKHLIVIHKLKQDEEVNRESNKEVDTEWLQPYLNPKPKEPQATGLKPKEPQATGLKGVLAKLAKKASQAEEKFEVDRYRHLYDVVKEATSKKDRKGQTFKRNPLTRAYKCNYCDKESKHHYVIQIHERLHTGEKPYICRLCDYRGAQQSRIIFHLKGKHADYLEAEDAQQAEAEARAKIDDAMDDASIQQDANSNASNQDHYVPRLGVDFTMERIESEEVLLEEIQESRNYECLTCGKRCANAVRTIEHMRQHTGAKPYACMRCSTRSAYDRAMRNHVLLQHGRNAKEKEKLYTFHPGKVEKSMVLRKHPSLDRYLCPFCSKTFRDVNLARSHIRMHTGEVPYRCKLCKFRGANTRAIMVHIERVHGNRTSTEPDNGAEAEEEAAEDGEILPKRLKLDNGHLPRSDESSTNNSMILSDDESSFKPDEPTIKGSKSYLGAKLGIDFTCDKIETENMYCKDPETGGYKCLYCDRVIKSRLVSKIQNHLLLHTGQKPFKCTHCDFHSAHDGSMRTHVLSQHRKISKSHEKLYKFKVGKIERSLRLDQEPSGAYVCPYCPKRCRDMQAAKKHIRCHTGEKPFRCRKCSYMATMKWSVILHAQRQHKSKKKSSKAANKTVKDDKETSSGKNGEVVVKAVLENNEGEVNDTEESTKPSEEKPGERSEEDVAKDKEEDEKMELDGVETSKKSKEEVTVDEQSNNESTTCDENGNNNEDSKLEDQIKPVDTINGSIAGVTDADDTKAVGKLEVDGAPMETETVDEQKVSSEADQTLKQSDAGKLETDGTAPEENEEQTPAAGSKTEEEAASENKPAEAEEKTEVEDKADGGIEGKNATESQEGPEKTDEDKSKAETKDAPAIQPVEQKPNQPDYIFKQSDEEKSVFKSNASGSFDCPRCSKQFRDIIVMQTHWRNHTGDMPYHCMHCSFKAARFPNIRQHMLFVHKIHRPKTIPKSSVVIEKVPETTTVPPLAGEIPFDQIRTMFTFVPSATTYHPMRNASGMFECPDCGSTSKRSNGARVHYRTHTGEKPYHCLLCPYKGAQQSRVVTHIKYNHLDALSGKSSKELDEALEEVAEKDETPVVDEQDDMMEDDEEGSLMIDEVGIDGGKGVKRKIDVDESSTGSGSSLRQGPMWGKGYEYRPSQAEMELVLEQDSNGLFLCHICPHKHKLKNVVRNHIRKHTGEKPYFCCHCDFTTANFSSMRTHLIQQHKSMPYRPEGSPAPDVEAPKKAKKVHHQEEEVPIPPSEETQTEGYTFTRSLLEKSLRLQRTVRGRYQCPYCSYEYGALAIVMAHVRTHTGDKPFQCNYCPYSAADYSAMRKHLIKKHDKWQPKGKVWSAVTVNQTSMDTPPELSREAAMMDDGSHHRVRTVEADHKRHHTEGLHYIYTCGEAEKGLSFHKSEAGKYECPYCPHQHKKKSVVRAHVRKHTGETPYQCKHCTFKCANFSWMREHLIKRHNLTAEQLSSKSKYKEGKEIKTSMSIVPDDVSPMPQSNVSSQQKPKFDFLFAPSNTEKHVELSRTTYGSYICVFCKKELRIINNMRAHIRGHLGDKPYFCTRCPFQSAHISALRRHLFSLHRIRNAKGQKCTKETALAMTNPLRAPSRAQPEPIPVIQPLKSSLDSQSSPIIHNILTAQPRAETHSPPVRGYPQPQVRSPVQRTNQYDPKGPKYTYEQTASEIALLKQLQASNTLQCPHCGHKFSSISRTMEHVRKHTGTKPYRCLICNFKSAYEGCISRHVSLKHELSAQQLAQFFTFKIGDIEKNTDLQKDPDTGHYNCPFCDKSWPESAKVKRHMCIHTGEKPYRCNLCGFGAVDKSSMVHHLEMSHKKKITELKDSLAEEEQGGSPIPHLASPVPNLSQQRTNFRVESKESKIRRVPESQREVTRRLPPQHMHQPSTSAILNVPSPSDSGSDDSTGYEYRPSQAEQELFHRLNAEGKVRCPHCGKICHSASRTLEHVRMHTGDKPYCCLHCSFASAYEGVMKKHVMVRHGKGNGLSGLYSFKAGKILKSIEFERDERTGRYKCPFCRRTMTSLTGAKRHVCTHTGEKPYKCKLCSYCANERSTILWHIDRQHKNADELAPEMARQEHQQQMQQQHQQKQMQQQRHREDPRKAAVTQALGLAPSRPQDHTANRSDPSRQQDHCASRSVVAINKRGHVDFNPTQQFKKVQVRPGDAEAITKLFSFQPGKIERSLNLQRDPENGRYLCPFCEQTSRDLTNAKNHVRVHIGEKPFKCHLCDYASVQRSLVIAHIEKHHVVYPSAPEYFPQEAMPSRPQQSASRRKQRPPVARSSYAIHPVREALPHYTAPGDDLPLDLSKPLDLSGSLKRKQPALVPKVVKQSRHGDATDAVAMDLSSGSHSIAEESQESSMEDEEAALLEEEMMAEEEAALMREDEGVMDEDEDMAGEDEEARLLEEEMLAEQEAAELEHEADALGSRSNMVQKPVRLVKPLNPNEANEDEGSSGEGKSGRNVTVGAVVTDGVVNPGVAGHSKKDERNIWDMAFNWSSSKKSGESSEKQTTARSLRYPDGEEGDMGDEPEDHEDMLDEADDVHPDGEGSEAGVLQRLLQKGQSPMDEDESRIDEDLQAIADAAEVSEAPATSTDVTDVHLPPDVPTHTPTVTSPHTSPIHEASHDLPGTSATWQTLQETTPTKPPSSASTSHTPDGDNDGQDELGSPSSLSGGLPIITNVMSLNPSLWKSP